MVEPEARFEALYDAHSHVVLGYALRRTERPEDAADVVAEVFLVVWRRLDDVPAGDAARLWLYGVARHVLDNQRRSARRRARLSARLQEQVRSEVGAVLRSAADRAVDEGPDRRAVGEALRALPERDREVLALLAWEGLDRDEVAAVLGCSTAAVRVRLHRARRRLRRELEVRGVEVPQRRRTTGHEPVGWVLARPDEEEAR